MAGALGPGENGKKRRTMKRGTPDHPKVLTLANRLGIKKYAAVGLLETLWHFTARYAPRGDVGRFSDGIIATSLDWGGNIPELIEALVKERWLDQNNEYRLMIHDWSEHADDTCDKYLANHGMTYADGKEPRRKPDKGVKVRKPAEKSGKFRKTPEKSSLSEPESESEPKPHSEGAGEGDVLNPDEAHRILKERPELRMLTWEQDLTARKDFQAAPVEVEWVKIARLIKDKAILAGEIDQAGSWLRSQYDKVIRGLYPDIFEKKAAGPGAQDPRKRIFRTREEKNGQANIQ